MDTLKTLREKNPHLAIYSVMDPQFKRYGKVIGFDAKALIAACEKEAVMPESGSCYQPSLPGLEAMEAEFAKVRHELRGENPCEIGCCWGYNSLLNALEYHRASEHNIAVSDMLLLLAKQEDMEGFELPAGKVVGFFVPQGTTIEVYATTLHFCPCQTGDAGFRCIVILPQGTNHALEQPRPENSDGRLLWAKDKWLIANPENTELVEKGAYPGLLGENFDIKY